MAGQIGAASQLGEGTTFWFTISLPVGTAAQTPPAAASPLAADRNAGLKNIFANRRARVLVADDVVSNQQVAVGILARMGLPADAVANGAEALAALNNVAYDLVLMDVQMPEVDGLEATRRIRTAESEAPQGSLPHPRLPVIAMTAGAMQDDRESCLQAGMDDFVSKPVMPRALAEVLAKWLPPESKQFAVPPPSALPAFTEDKPAPPPPSSIFDMAELLDRMEGSTELAGDILDCFLEEIPEQIQSLWRAVETGRSEEIAQQAHRLKGASANVGGKALQALALEMELAAKANDLTVVRARSAEIDQQFVRLREAIAKQR
jgi:CheY-like chemotaxis protein/HPt (histidine-containing phosphotransfer) domain-containing protein